MSFAYLFERFPSFVQTFCYREAVEMVQQGMEPLILSIRRPEDAPELAESLSVPVVYLPEEKALRAEVDQRRTEFPSRVRRALSKHRQRPDAQRLFEAAWLAPLLRERRIEHVHAHFGGLAARTAWWLRKLFCVNYSFTGHANDIFCENDFPVTNALLVRDAVFVATETDYARRWMEERHTGSRRKIFRVLNGIDTDGFPPREPAAGPPRLLSVGRYVEKKGFAHLIEACRRLKSHGLAFQCEIVGGGPLAAALQTQIDEGGLADCVHLPGPRAQAEVRRMLAQASLFVLACVPETRGGTDNLPTVIMEAMAAGVPVVSTHLAGVPEMITDGVDGRLVAPSDSAALADAIAALLRDPAMAARLAAAGAATAQAKFALAGTTRALKLLLVKEAAVLPPPEALRLEPTLAGIHPGWWRRVRLGLGRFLLVAAALAMTGCFVVKDAVKDSVEAGAYAAREGTHVALRTTAATARVTARVGRAAVHSVSEAAAPGPVPVTPAPLPPTP